MNIQILDKKGELATGLSQTSMAYLMEDLLQKNLEVKGSNFNSQIYNYQINVQCFAKNGVQIKHVPKDVLIKKIEKYLEALNKQEEKTFKSDETNPFTKELLEEPENADSSSIEKKLPLESIKILSKNEIANAKPDLSALEERAKLHLEEASEPPLSSSETKPKQEISVLVHAPKESTED